MRDWMQVQFPSKVVSDSNAENCSKSNWNSWDKKFFLSEVVFIWLSTWGMLQTRSGLYNTSVLRLGGFQ